MNKKNFPIRTGDISYEVGINVPSLTGGWSVSLGFSGVKDETWGISGESGKIYDNTGYMIGSYLPNQETVLSGTLFENHHSIYQNNTLLSNCSQHEPNDYNTVTWDSSYIGGFTPNVFVRGVDISNENNVQTHQFWGDKKDKVLFATENAQADAGFINIIESMGIPVVTGNRTGVSGGNGLDDHYNLVVLGSATSSGAYDSASWGSINTSIMSLNSHLVAPNNLGWYSSLFSDRSKSLSKQINKTGRIFDTKVLSPDGTPSLWVENVFNGWERMFYNSSLSTATSLYYTPYGVNTLENYYTMFNFSAEEITVYDGQNFYQDSFGDISDYFIGANITGGLEYDIELDWSNNGQNGRITYISNDMGGEGIFRRSDFTTGGQYYTGYDQGLRIEQENTRGKSFPKERTYNFSGVYKHLNMSNGPFEMYNSDIETIHGYGGECYIDSPLSGQAVTVWHVGSFTGDQTNGRLTSKELMLFSVTSTGLGWATGQDMWETLTPTGKRLFVNSVMQLFV